MQINLFSDQLLGGEFMKMNSPLSKVESTRHNFM